MAGSLTGQLALVTGAGRGMGQAHARRLAADGATVVVNDAVASPELVALAEELGGVVAVADVSDRDAVAGMIETLDSALGPISILVANHAYMSMAPLAQDNEADWWRVVDVNLGGTFNLIQAVLPGMRSTGSGRIIIIASEWGVIGWPEATAYAASKAGLISLTKSLGRELAPEGIIVNAIAPGVTDTPQLQVDADSAGVSLADVKARYARDIPLGRIGEAEEIAAAVSLLADPDLGSMVGQVIQVNGGSTRTRV